MPIAKGSTVLVNGTSRPRNRYETVVAVTEESSSGRMEDMEMLNSSISRQNRIPAIGALKIPATAPAAPQHRRMVMFL